jgi:hypothetical protein
MLVMPKMRFVNSMVVTWTVRVFLYKSPRRPRRAVVVVAAAVAVVVVVVAIMAVAIVAITEVRHLAMVRQDMVRQDTVRHRATARHRATTATAAVVVVRQCAAAVVRQPTSASIVESVVILRGIARTVASRFASIAVVLVMFRAIAPTARSAAIARALASVLAHDLVLVRAVASAETRARAALALVRRAIEVAKEEARRAKCRPKPRSAAPVWPDVTRDEAFVVLFWLARFARACVFSLSFRQQPLQMRRARARVRSVLLGARFRFRRRSRRCSAAAAAALMSARTAVVVVLLRFHRGELGVRAWRRRKRAVVAKAKRWRVRRAERPRANDAHRLAVRVRRLKRCDQQRELRRVLAHNFDHNAIAVVAHHAQRRVLGLHQNHALGARHLVAIEHAHSALVHMSFVQIVSRLENVSDIGGALAAQLLAATAIAAVRRHGRWRHTLGSLVAVRRRSCRRVMQAIAAVVRRNALRVHRRRR